MDSTAPITINDDVAAGSNAGPTVEASRPSQATSRRSRCVHFEHAGQEEAKGEVRQAEPATPPVAMSSYRLLVCLSILGWSERDLARRTGRHQTTIVRWIKGLSPVPGEEAAWLERLAVFHVANPAPRSKRLISAFNRRELILRQSL